MVGGWLSWVGYPTCVFISVGGRAATFGFEGGFGFGGVRFFVHIRVYESATGKRKIVCSSPHGSPFEGRSP